MDQVDTENYHFQPEVVAFECRPFSGLALYDDLTVQPAANHAPIPISVSGRVLRKHSTADPAAFLIKLNLPTNSGLRLSRASSICWLPRPRGRTAWLVLTQEGKAFKLNSPISKFNLYLIYFFFTTL
ncbi:MAG: hypothetical protein NMK33_01780 [Candidatus Cardinium sp.]|uniref:hypothetical protein n=1 Tax=Cardinium endosymbiont of Dermatophagoides farinae TaxID=2597823 RepID=UPI001183049C|nr:hypothetical protein [Cardinium endosymbiont of Dermatophagoides farinae]TSJ81222.1 hypothetical protein FPG78_04465 [Cardinium endosymbiont of Dermatophagoides farinae]UWW97272.1 MAG: hypothetical protein NMK33_01780 [Candidatus Cardinium sp.]